MLIKIAHHDDGKEKCCSHECYLIDTSEFYSPTDIENIRGYGATKEEALDDLRKELEYYFAELHALATMLYTTDVLNNDIIEVDCLGGKIK